MNINYIPHEKDSELLQLEGDRVFIPHNADGDWRPPLVRIGGVLRRLTYVRDGNLHTNINRHSPPINIQKVYYGRPGETLSILPVGGKLIGESSTGYVFLDSNYGQVSLDTFQQSFPANMGAEDVYYVYSALNGAGPILEFKLKSAPEVVPIQVLEVSSVNYDIPAEVYPGLDGIGAMRFTVDVFPVNETVTMSITSLTNITLSKLSGITEDESIEYEIVAGSTGDVVITYHFVTNTGKRTMDYQMVIPNSIGNGDALPYSFIQSFPTELNPNESFTWRYGNVATGISLQLVAIQNLITGHTGLVSPGQAVTFQVTGQTGEPASITYALLYDGGILGTHTTSALIGNESFDVSGMTYTTSPDESNLFPSNGQNSIDITISGLDGYTDIAMYPPNSEVYVSDPSINGSIPTFTVTVSEQYDPTVPLILPVVVKGVNSAGVVINGLFEITLTVQKASGSEAIGLSRIFTKPATATTLTITSSGGAGYESTILTGLVHYSFPGGLTMPAQTAATFHNLTPEEETITFDLAEGATAFVIWS